MRYAKEFQKIRREKVHIKKKNRCTTDCKWKGVMLWLCETLSSLTYLKLSKSLINQPFFV